MKVANAVSHQHYIPTGLPHKYLCFMKAVMKAVYF